MRKCYTRKAWLLDDGILLEGYTSKKKFYPKFLVVDLVVKKSEKKDIGKILFYKINKDIKYSKYH